MTWQQRLLQMGLAGGVAALAGCDASLGQGAIPCGNANPNPCICDRPAAGAAAKALCDQEKACQASGGTFFPYGFTDAMGVTHSEASCQKDGGVNTAGDAGASD